jgi:hypothetical protein
MKYVIFPTENEAEEYRVRLQAFHDSESNQDPTKPKIIDCIVKTWRGEYALTLLNDTWPDVGKGSIVDNIDDPRTQLLEEIVKYFEKAATTTPEPGATSGCIGAYIKLCSLAINEPIDKYITSSATGALYKIHIPANPEALLTQMIQPLILQRNPSSLTLLLDTLNNYVRDLSIDYHVKFSILNVENRILRQSVISDLPLGALDLGKNYCIIRRALVLDVIENPLKYFTDQEALSNGPILIALHHLYVDTERDLYLRANRCKEVMPFFDALLSSVPKHKAVLWGVLRSAVTANHRVMVLTADKMREKIDLYRDVLDKEDLEGLDRAIEYATKDGEEITSVTIQLADASFRGIAPGELYTEIQFVLPFEIRDGMLEEDREVTLANGLSFRVDFRRLKSVYEDPMIIYLANIGSESIGGLPSAFLSDVNPDLLNGSTLVLIKLGWCEALDFDVTADGVIKEKPFDDEKAIRGGQYFPHKELAITLLRTLYKNMPLQFPVECNLDQLHIDIFSNFIVCYRRKEYPILIMHLKEYLLTSRDAFNRARIRYSEKISELYREDKHVSIKSLLNNSDIHTNESFRNFIYKVTELTVKEYIEQHSCWEFLWEESLKHPKPEPRAHPLINSYLRSILELKGIRISAEVETGNGAIDFLCSYTTTRNDVLKVCVEVKNAHADGLEDGITLQLPAYMKAEQTRHGIYIVLWYKNEDWSQPKKFGSIAEMGAKLEAIKPNDDCCIDIMCVNCTKPIPPSRM